MLISNADSWLLYHAGIRIERGDMAVMRDRRGGEVVSFFAYGMTGAEIVDHANRLLNSMKRAA